MYSKNDFLILPDHELRKIYRRKVKQQKFLSAVPMLLLAVCVLVYGFSGWVNYLAAELFLFRNVSSFGLGILFYIALFIHGIVLLIDDIRIQKINIICFAGVYMVLFMVFKLSGLDLSILMACMLAYNYLAELADIKLIRTINEMRELPSFPFNGEHKKMVAESSLSREQMSEYLKRMDKDQCISTGFEDILDGNIDAYKPEEQDRSDFFQQHDFYR